MRLIYPGTTSPEFRPCFPPQRDSKLASAFFSCLIGGQELIRKLGIRRVVMGNGEEGMSFSVPSLTRQNWSGRHSRVGLPGYLEDPLDLAGKEAPACDMEGFTLTSSVRGMQRREPFILPHGIWEAFSKDVAEFCLKDKSDFSEGEEQF